MAARTLLRSLKPDFKTIADFRSDNRAAFKKVFRDFVILCRRLDLFGRELLAVDGTRIKAVNNKDRNFTTGSLQKFIEAADKKLEDYLNRLDAGDAEECATGGSRVKNLAEKIEALKKKRGEYAANLTALEKSGESQISMTDPDSRAMAAYTKVGVGYNVQIAVDAKNKMIVEQAVTNDVLDMGLLQQTAEPARQILDVETIDVVADKGYFKSEDIAACEAAGLTPHGVVTSLKEEHDNSASLIFSNDRNCLAPHVHSQLAKGSVCPCRNEMTLDVECIVGGCVSWEKSLG